MVPKKNSWSIVILGMWNRMIFDPNWLGKNIFETDMVECLVSIMPQDPTVFKKDGIALLIQDNRLIFRVEECSRETLILAEQKAHKIIQMLPHTPLKAIGLNLGYTIEEDGQNELLLSVFNHGDDALLTSMGWQVDKRTVERVLEKESDPKHILKYIMSLEDKVTVSANFHHDVANSNEALIVLDNRAGGLLDDFNSLLTTVYGLS